MRVSSTCLAVVSIVLGACGGGGSGGSGSGGGSGTTLMLRATDVPFVHDQVEEATIDVDRITIHRQADGDAGPFVLYEGPPIEMVLTDLRDGLSQLLSEQDLEPGTYRQIRLRVVHATLTLVNGNFYTTDDGTIHLSSQGTSGFKVLLDPPLELQEGTTADLLLDFDLPRTFHPIPPNDPMNAHRFNLQPVIHGAVIALAGGIEGTVQQDDGQGGLEPVVDATVYVLPPGSTDRDDSVASTPTGANGHYAVAGLHPGTYDVLAVKDDAQASVTGVVVERGATTTVDLVLPSGPTGGIRGIVQQDDGTGHLVPVPATDVFVLPPGVTDPDLAVQKTLTIADGTYSMSGIPVGTWDVLAIHTGGAHGTVLGVVVVENAFTTVDLVIQ